jgi:hypothetical protein
MSEKTDGIDTQQLLALLRANGVTRYKRGDLEIELGPTTADPGGHGAALPPPTETQQRLDASMDHALDRRFNGEDKPSAEPAAADGAPPVEIDMEETRRLLEEQQARRRGEQ